MSAPEYLTTEANEKSTYNIVVTFTDENGDAVSPTTMTWTLTRASTGLVVNGREDEVVATPTSSETIKLTNDDLELLGSEDEIFILTVKATIIDGDTNTWYANDEVQFIVKNLVGVS